MLLFFTKTNLRQVKSDVNEVESLYALVKRQQIQKQKLLQC